jgi:16S rRNA A1518/A1519 N6-dimethyltransferase RsmA/KsgA/DIM1 with predicted DNA glycosylase/AP lyase activity
MVVTAVPSAQRMQRSPDIHFVPTPNNVVDAMLDIAAVGPGDVVYDLGSGDGRIVIAAARRGARGVGVELDPRLVAESTRNATKAGVADSTQFIEGDIFKTDLSKATVVTLYLLSSINQRLRPKLLRELKPGSRIVSHRFRMGAWEPEQSRKVAGKEVFLWRVPAP